MAVHAKYGITLIACLLLSPSFADASPDSEDKKQGLTDYYLVQECKGDIKSEGKYVAFQELRRRGEVPEFSLERCLEWGIIPPWTKEEEGEG